MRLGFFFVFFASSVLFLRVIFFFCVFAFFLCSYENGCRSRRISFSSLPCNMTLLFIKNKNNLLYTYSKRQSKYFFIYKTAVLFCVFVFIFLSLRFFFAFSFFLRLRFYTSSFSEICVFVLRNMGLRSQEYASSFFSKNENYVNLRSGEYCT